MAEHTDYRIAFILPESRQLLGFQASGVTALPSISVPARQRPAEKLAEQIKEKWQIRSLVLDVIADAATSENLAIIEVRTPGWSFEAEGFCSVQPSKSGGLSLGEDQHRVLQNMLLGHQNGRGPFSCIGWIDEAQDWIRTAVNGRKLNFSSDVRQLNAGGHFALVRLGTAQDTAYWFKAVGEPNEHEFRITRALAEYFPDYLPVMVACRQDWNAWVMEEAGTPLSENLTLHAMENVIFSLADLQIKSIDQVEKLLSVGCLDLRIHRLESHLRAFTHYLDDSMDRQTSTKVPRIPDYRLHEIEDIVRDACARLQALGIPDTLLHHDINPDNVLFDGSRSVFTDWAEAAIGNPFLTFQHFCAHITRLSNEANTWLPELKNIYRQRWLESMSEAKVDEAFRLTPLLSVVSCLYGRGEWLESNQSAEPAFQGYMRALARHLDRAAQAPELLEVLCH